MSQENKEFWCFDCNGLTSNVSFSSKNGQFICDDCGSFVSETFDVSEEVGK